jgi:hypothetical protein
MMRVATSKILLTTVIVGGLIGLLAGIDPSRNQLIGYSLIFFGALFNRLDSRKQGYKFSAAIGSSSLSVEGRGDDN